MFDDLDYDYPDYDYRALDDDYPEEPAHLSGNYLKEDYPWPDDTDDDWMDDFLFDEVDCLENTRALLSTICLNRLPRAERRALLHAHGM